MKRVSLIGNVRRRQQRFLVIEKDNYLHGLSCQASLNFNMTKVFHINYLFHQLSVLVNTMKIRMLPLWREC